MQLLPVMSLQVTIRLRMMLNNSEPLRYGLNRSDGDHPESAYVVSVEPLLQPLAVALTLP